MVPQRHARCTDGIRRAQVTCPARCEARQVALAPPIRRKKKSCWRRDSSAPCSRLYHGSILSRVVSKSSFGVEEEQAMANVYRLHKPEQGLPQGPVCSAEDRSGDRLHSRMRAVELL